VTDRTRRPGCGTRAGYYAHVKRSEACDRCEQAHDNYLAQQKARRKAAAGRGERVQVAPPPPTGLVVPGEWVDAGACIPRAPTRVEPDTFYPQPSHSAAYAKRVCNGTDERPACPVRIQCLQYALDNDDQWGVYGGLTVKERQRPKRGRVA
jgi:WhiB family redox-sensing transcriptional regulator